MELPAAMAYRDLNSDSVVQQLTPQAVDSYMTSVDKKLERIWTELYHDGYINYIRFAKTDACYFKAECRAQMRARVAYVVDVSVNDAGTIEKCQCECAVGMGPTAHCKHVGAVLYGLSIFSQSKDFTVHETCTQKLQTFHQTKKHSGTPVKAQNLALRVNKNIDYDPRPVQYINQDNYVTSFKNTLINSGVMCTAPISQILYPANPLAVLRDHDYHMVRDPVESFFLSQKISEISQSEIDALQQATCGQSSNPVWKAERLKRMTLSNFGRICKLTDKTNAPKFAKSFLTDHELLSAAVQHGRTYEAEAVKKYSEICTLSSSVTDYTTTSII